MILEFNGDFFAAPFGWVLSHETILAVKFDRFAAEIVFLNVREDLGHVFAIHVFPCVEQQVSRLFMDVFFSYFFTV